MSRVPTCPKTLIIGRGKVGHGLRAAAIGGSLARPDCRLRSLAKVRDADLRWANLILLTVPDDAIEVVAAQLAERDVDLPPVVHVSGSRPTDAAAACVEHGALHPLASFASAKRPPSLRDAFFAVGGTPEAIRCATAFARACGGRPFTNGQGRRHAELQGPTYHAAAALAANGGAALAVAAVDVLVRSGVPVSQAQAGIAALLRTVAHNVQHLDGAEALTGPVARGDLDTVRAHRKALVELEGPAAEAYDATAPAILACAVDAGLDAKTARSMRRSLARPLIGRRRRR